MLKLLILFILTISITSASYIAPLTEREHAKANLSVKCNKAISKLESSDTFKNITTVMKLCSL